MHKYKNAISTIFHAMETKPGKTKAILNDGNNSQMNNSN